MVIPFKYYPQVTNCYSEIGEVCGSWLFYSCLIFAFSYFFFIFNLGSLGYSLKLQLAQVHWQDRLCFIFCFNNKENILYASEASTESHKSF